MCIESVNGVMYHYITLPEGQLVPPQFWVTENQCTIRDPSSFVKGLASKTRSATVISV